jgi:hypothetical protein
VDLQSRASSARHRNGPTRSLPFPLAVLGVWVGMTVLLGALRTALDMLKLLRVEDPGEQLVAPPREQRSHQPPRDSQQAHKFTSIEGAPGRRVQPRREHSYVGLSREHEPRREAVFDLLLGHLPAAPFIILE